MIALAGMWCGFHLAQQGVHFIKHENCACPDAAMARHRAANMLDFFTQRKGFSEFRQIIGEIVQQAFYIQLPKQCGGFSHNNGIAAKRLDDKTQPLKLVFALQQALALYDIYQARVVECDAMIEAVLAKLGAGRRFPTSRCPKRATELLRVTP